MLKKSNKGRPPAYTFELAEQICDVIATTSQSLRKMNEIYPFFPDPSTIHQWRKDHSEFSDKYWRAKLIQADILVEEILDIADECNADSYAQAKLRIETRKWIASKLLPKKYGDKCNLEADKEESERTLDEIKAIRARLAEAYKRDY